MCSELPGEVIQGVKNYGRNRSASDPRGDYAPLYRCDVEYRADELVTDTQLGGSGLKQSREIPLAVGETIGKFKAVIRLDAFHADTSGGHTT